jgi:autotransporter-associated beta strand protein
MDRAGSSGVVYFDLAGRVQTLAGLTSDFGSNAVINSTGSSTLTVSNSADAVFNGMIGTSGKAGINLIKQGNAMLTLNGTNLYTGGTTISAGTMCLNGLITATTGLLVSSNATLQIGLGAPGGPTNIVVNGNVTLGGQINVSDNGFAPGATYPVIHYTGNLTNNGVTVAPLAPCEFTIDTSVPHVVSLVVGEKYPLAQFNNTNLAVSTLTTNLSGILRGLPAGSIWYEVRDQARKLWDFGATRAVTPWNITVRHLREGTNTVTVFAKDGSGVIQSNSVQLTLTLGPNPGVRPRPIPSEVWWGGLSDNYQMTNYAQWPFVQKYEDGYFMHSSGWGGDTAGLQRSLATNLFAFNTKYWTELGGGQSTITTNTGHSQASTWGNSAATREGNGIIYSEFTHDYHMEDMKDVCQANPTWPTNDQIAFWTGDLTVAGGAYPYDTGIWRDAFIDYYARFPHVKVGHTSQPEYWPWDSYPAEVVNQISFTVTNPVTAFSFNAHDIVGSFVNMAGEIGHPYFSFQSDAPWNWFGAYSNPSAAAVMREKIRVYEDYLQARDCRHTLICNVGNASAANQGSTNAANLYYESCSLSNMFLHQQEGGRANRYLFEGWYFGIPYAVTPETQAGSYTHLALAAIKYIKGIADTNGTLEQLKLGILATGMTNRISLTNNGDVACLPAITASESGSEYLTARYFNAAGQDVTAAMLNGEGYCHTNMLQPGQSTTLTVVVNGLIGAALDSTRSITFEAYWNPQDPTGVIRDRKTISVTASNLVSSADTDGDGMNDAGELALGRNPFHAGDLGFEFNTDGNFEGWGGFINLTNPAVSGGSITGASSTGDPNFWRGGFNFVGNNVSNLMVRIRASTAGMVQLFWGRVGSTGFTAGKRVDVAYGPANTWQLVMFPLATNAEWKDQTITSLRLDPISVAGQTFEIDWLRATNGNLAAPNLAPIANRTLIAGQTLSVTNVATDAEVPLTFSLLSPPVGAAINASNGVFTWRPAIAQSPSTTPISVKVTDSGVPPLSATQSFSVFVLRPAQPAMSAPAISNGVFSLTVSGDPGPDYGLFASTNLTDWLLLQQSNSPVLPFRFVDPAATNFDRRYYRIQLLP